jgi:hypothetical protein
MKTEFGKDFTNLTGIYNYVERLRENPLPAYAGPFPLSGGHKKGAVKKSSTAPLFR